MLADVQLQQIMPRLAAARLQLFLPHLNQAMAAHGVDTMLRTAAFIAQLAHESGEFRWMEEIWGPTEAQRRYEPPGTLAARLGNTQPGDGKLFKGRGPIQITGRFNYAKYGALLGVDLVAEPALAAAPEVAFATAGLYWSSNGLNELADAKDFVAITKRINGGTNGLADRQMYYALAQRVLASGFVAGAATRAAARRVPGGAAGPLLRGYEAIAEAGATPGVRKSAPRKPATKKQVTAPLASKKPAGKSAKQAG